MACYSFANCIMDSFPRKLAYCGGQSDSFRNMHTAGIVMLLTGKRIAMHPEDEYLMRASKEWTKFYREKEQSLGKKRLLKWDEFEPITVNREDTFLWSPFADFAAPYSAARNHNGEPYPWTDDPFNGILVASTRPTMEANIRYWVEMNQALAHVERKGVLIYPTVGLNPPKYSEEHIRKLRDGIDEYNRMATELMSSLGWKVFVPENPECEDYWAHYTRATLDDLYKRVILEFVL